LKEGTEKGDNAISEWYVRKKADTMGSLLGIVGLVQNLMPLAVRLVEFLL
jgi:hypothetical protein